MRTPRSSLASTSQRAEPIMRAGLRRSLGLSMLLAAGLGGRTYADEREQAELRVAEPIRATTLAGGAHTYRVPLAQRDCAFGVLAVDDANAIPELRVRRAGSRKPRPSQIVRRYRGSPGLPLEFELCVEPAGDYLFEVSAGATASPYQLTLESILTRPTASLPPPVRTPRPPRSPRLQSLEAGLRIDPDASAALWRELAAHGGSPLLEPLSADHMLVTFLYRAEAPVHSVSVQWAMFTDAFAQTDLQQLGDSDVWWLSIALPKATRLSYQLAIDAPRLKKPADEHLRDRCLRAVARADPRNPQLMTADPDVDAFALRSVLALPGAPPEPPLQARAHGRLERQALLSQKLAARYPLTVYLPPGYRAQGASYPLLIAFDGEGYLDPVALPALLDARIAARALGPLIVVFVHNASLASRGTDLPCNARFAEFVAHELLPYVQARYPVAREQKRVGLLGASFGGLASSYIAFMYPALFGKVLSQSGSYWWSFPRGHAAFDGDEQPGWLRRRYQQRAHEPIELYLSAGLFETKSDGTGVLEQNRLQRDALRALGYSVAYQEFVGGHDWLQWRATLPDALSAMFPPGT